MKDALMLRCNKPRPDQEKRGGGKQVGKSLDPDQGGGSFNQRRQGTVADAVRGDVRRLNLRL